MKHTTGRQLPTPSGPASRPAKAVPGHSSRPASPPPDHARGIPEPDGHPLRRWLPLLLPLLPAALAFAWLGGDTPAFLLWWLTLTIFGLAFLPRSGRLFHLSPDRGYLFAKPLGLILTAVTVFILSTLHLAPFRTLVIAAVLALLAAAVHLPAANRAFWRTAAADPGILTAWGIEEAVFGFASLYWTFARGLHPALDSLEKFMDYGFMMSLWRTDFLPAADMWLAGKPINYYYFGQYLATFWAKACGVAPVQAYNLAMASMFALTLCLSLAVALLIGAIFCHGSRRVSRLLPPVYGGTAAILLTLGGNGHIFYYGGSTIGTWLYERFRDFGWPVGARTVPYWFADATRYIGYNPDTADKTIHEFPYYSFLVADLHAHVVSLLPVLLTLGLLAVLITRPLGPARPFRPARPLRPGQSLHAAAAALPEPHLLLLAVLLAVFMMGNYWDFVIYLAVAACVLVLRPQLQPATVTHGRAALLAGAGLLLLAVPFLLISSVPVALAAYAAAAAAARFSERRWTHPLTVTVARLAELFFLAHLIALPFNIGFEPIAKTIARARTHTPLIQLWILYGFFFIAGLVFIIDLRRQRRAAEIRAISRFQAEPHEAAPAAAGTGSAAAGAAGSTSGSAAGSSSGSSTSSSRFLARLLDLSPADRLLLVFLICGFGLILLPELVYVVDIYSGEFKRANTMFKFTYQAFILLSFVLAWAPLRLLFQPPAAIAGPAWAHKSEEAARAVRQRRAMGYLLLLLFVPSLMYPAQVTTQWLGSFSRSNYQGLDGVRLFAVKDSAGIPGSAPGELAPDYAAVQWFNTHVTGQPVILEAYGDSYSDNCRISAYTGLPTVIGWQTHEWLWRTSRATPDAYGSVVVPHQNDVRTMYTSTDRSQVVRLLDQYQVRYIVIGDLERQKFTATAAGGIAPPAGTAAAAATIVNEALLRSLGRVAFEQGSLVVIERT